jgi:4-hydroxy-tetrahydrodipicolinate synthase
MMIPGSFPAIVTPMHADGSLDLARLTTLVDWHIAQGSDGIVAVGTTGESPTVNVSEHCEIIRCIVAAAAGRVPVIAGTGGNSTTEAIELAQFAQQAGATAHLSVVPYYNKPTQEGLYQHFKTVAERVDLPMILYNVPGRTVADLSNDTALRLSAVPNIVGIKDATGNIERGLDLIKRAPSSWAIYSGDDASALALTLLGGRGVISVTANVAPRLMHDMIVAARAGDMPRARAINDRLQGLHHTLFLEANPIPVKWACAQMGLIAAGIRLPLTPFSAQYHDALRGALREADIVI